jgi:hypothetical protein|tara:strand:+ start:439 stop:633 length:195 start_codon:yes stop_codon:yes gene_type:complete
MKSQNYWVVRYYLNNTKHIFHIEASLKWYNEEKILKIFQDLHPDWENITATPVENLKFKTPDGG